MAWDSLQSVVNDTTQRVMAEPDLVIYTKGSGAVSVRGIFQSEHVIVSTGEGDIDSREPVLTVNDDELAEAGVVAEQGDDVTVRGLDYRVSSVQPDEKGQTKLKLLLLRDGEDGA